MHAFFVVVVVSLFAVRVLNPFIAHDVLSLVWCRCGLVLSCLVLSCLFGTFVNDVGRYIKVVIGDWVFGVVGMGVSSPR